MEVEVEQAQRSPGKGMNGEVPHAGCAASMAPYVLVDDIAASTEKAKSLGARVLADVTEIPGMGSFSMLVDPTGAAFALWQPKMPA
jgi:uncharacterized protein